MPRYLRFEIAQARPPQSFVQIDFGHNHGPPLSGVNEHIARVIINGGEHPQPSGAEFSPSADAMICDDAINAAVKRKLLSLRISSTPKARSFAVFIKAGCASL
jgi:hypothetical protein